MRLQWSDSWKAPSIIFAAAAATGRGFMGQNQGCRYDRQYGSQQPRELSPTPQRGSRGWEVQGTLTSMEHRAVAELCPVPATAQQGIVGDHGGIMASSSPTAFRAPPPVRLWERQHHQGRALEIGMQGTWLHQGGGNSSSHRARAVGSCIACTTVCRVG